METQKTGSSAAIWVLGITALLLFFWAVNKLDSRLEGKSFSSSYSSTAQPQVVPLSGDRFAVVDNDGYNPTITVFSVDAKGGVSRLSKVETLYKQLEPYEVPVKPTPRP